MSRDLGLTFASLLIILSLWIGFDLWLLHKGTSPLPEVSKEELAPLEPEIDESVFLKLKERKREIFLTPFRMATPSATPSD